MTDEKKTVKFEMWIREEGQESHGAANTFAVAPADAEREAQQLLRGLLEQWRERRGAR